MALNNNMIDFSALIESIIRENILTRTALENPSCTASVWHCQLSSPQIVRKEPVLDHHSISQENTPRTISVWDYQLPPLSIPPGYGITKPPYTKTIYKSTNVSHAPTVVVPKTDYLPREISPKVNSNKHLVDFPVMCEKLIESARKLMNMKCRNNEGFYLKDDNTLLFIGKYNSNKIIIELLDDHVYTHTVNYMPVRCRYEVKNGKKIYNEKDLAVRRELVNNLEIYRYVIYLYSHAFYIGIALHKIREIEKSNLASPIWENSFNGTCSNCKSTECSKSFTIKCYKPTCNLVTKYCNLCGVKNERTCCNLWYLVASDYNSRKKAKAYYGDRKSDIEKFVNDITRVFGSPNRKRLDQSSYFYKLKLFIEDIKL